MRYNFENFRDVGNVTCVYGILCVPTKKWYIGQTRCFRRRLSDHVLKLNTSKHRNRHLQRAFDKYGASSFEIDIFKHCDIVDLNEQEKFFIDKLDTTNPKKGYNIHFFDENGNSTYLPEFGERIRVGRKHRFSYGDAKVMRELYAMGYEPMFIRQKYKINITHLSKILNNRFWVDPAYVKPKIRPILNPDKAKIVEQLRQSGRKMTAISKLTGIHWNTLRKHYNYKPASL